MSFCHINQIIYLLLAKHSESATRNCSELRKNATRIFLNEETYKFLNVFINLDVYVQTSERQIKCCHVYLNGMSSGSPT